MTTINFITDLFLKGIDTEPHYLIEIEDIENEIDELQKRKVNITEEFHV